VYDVIVVGARCAGAPAAMLFARAGYRTLLIDRARFPADTLSTLYVHQPAVARLASWGVLEAVKATGCPPLDRVIYQMDDVRLDGCASGVDGISAGYAPRRYLLDQVLAEHAVAAGAEFRDGCAVRELIVSDGRVSGVRCSAALGGASAERASLVVGADGMRSTVARLAGARTLLCDPRLTCAYYTFWDGLASSFELHEGTGGWVSTVPTNHGATLVAAYFPQQQFESIRHRALDAYLGNVRATAPEVFDRLGGAQRCERLRGTGDQQNFFRQAHGAGWVLVGDAGHHKDSITARGISDAFMQAELLARLVGDRLHDERALRAALARFAAEREAMLMDGYRGTLLVAQMAASERRRALLRTIAADPGMVTRYFDVFAGIRGSDELYPAELAPRA